VLAGPLFCLPKVIGYLHPNPQTGRLSKRFGNFEVHFSRDAGVLVQQFGEMRTRYAQVSGELSHRETEFRQHVFLQNFAWMPRISFHPGYAMTYGRRMCGQDLTTGILPIFTRHSAGPVSCTEVPLLSTATVTGMSCTVNS
jgi:hypothetical protein